MQRSGFGASAFAMIMLLDASGFASALSPKLALNPTPLNPKP